MLFCERKNQPEYRGVKVHVQMAVDVRQSQAGGGKALELGLQLGGQFGLGCAAKVVEQPGTQRIREKEAVRVRDVRDPVRG